MNFNTEPKREAQLPADYEAYAQLIAPLNENHPQFQGLQPEEFAAALNDPTTACTEIEHEGRNVRIPQLVNIRHFEWLNQPRYMEEFPQSNPDEIVHFMDLPGLEAGPEVLERMKETADRGGVIIFDYPSEDQDYPQRVVATAKAAGVPVESVHELATQTYFAGEVQLVREQDGPVKSFPESFEDMVASGAYDKARIANGASLSTRVSSEDAEHMRQFYDNAYVDLNAKEFCSQGIPADEFMHMTTEDENVVKVMNSVDGEIVSLMLLDNDLSHLSWVNSNFYEKLFPEKYAQGQVMWFPGLAANPNKKGGFNTQIMVNLLAEVAENGNNDIVVVFDCGILNTGFLDTFLNEMINKTEQTRVDIKPIAAQKYCALVPSTR